MESAWTGNCNQLVCGGHSSTTEVPVHGVTMHTMQHRKYAECVRWAGTRKGVRSEETIDKERARLELDVLPSVAAITVFCIDAFTYYVRFANPCITITPLPGPNYMRHRVMRSSYVLLRPSVPPTFVSTTNLPTFPLLRNSHDPAHTGYHTCYLSSRTNDSNSNG